MLLHLHLILLLSIKSFLDIDFLKKNSVHTERTLKLQRLLTILRVRK